MPKNKVSGNIVQSINFPPNFEVEPYKKQTPPINIEYICDWIESFLTYMEDSDSGKQFADSLSDANKKLDFDKLLKKIKEIKAGLTKSAVKKSDIKKQLLEIYKLLNVNMFSVEVKKGDKNYWVDILKVKDLLKNINEYKSIAHKIARLARTGELSEFGKLKSNYVEKIIPEFEKHLSCFSEFLDENFDYKKSQYGKIIKAGKQFVSDVKQLKDKDLNYKGKLIKIIKPFVDAAGSVVGGDDGYLMCYNQIFTLLSTQAMVRVKMLIEEVVKNLDKCLENCNDKTKKQVEHALDELTKKTGQLKSTHNLAGVLKLKDIGAVKMKAALLEAEVKKSYETVLAQAEKLAKDVNDSRPDYINNKYAQPFMQFILEHSK